MTISAISICHDCNYPTGEDGVCRNPVCKAVNPEAAAYWAEQAEIEKWKREERERLARIREQAWSYRSDPEQPAVAD